MKIETYITVRTVAVAAAVGLALFGIMYAAGALAQEAVPAPAVTTAQPSARHAGFIGALKGGAIGCLAGGILGKFTHHSVLKSCAVGGAAGAVIGGVRAYRAQMQAAQELAAQTRMAGGTASIETRDVQAKSDAGGSETTAALKTMTLNLNAQGVADRSADTRAVLAKAATLAAQANAPVTIQIAGDAADRDWIASQLQAGVGGARNVQIEQTYATAPSLQIAMAQS